MKKISQERLVKDVRRVLENPFWIPELKTKETYTRLHDDHDGTFEGKISIMFSSDGDAYVSTDKSSFLLRFRTEFGGGGMSPRVRNALMILAFAIELDNQKRPQK